MAASGRLPPIAMDGNRPEAVNAFEELRKRA